MRWKKQNQNQISENWVKVSFRFLLDFPSAEISLRGVWLDMMQLSSNCLFSVLILEFS